jgi:hypothetical protein
MSATYHLGMRTFTRALIGVFAAVLLTVSAVMPARADLDVSGTYRIVTGTGKHMIVTLIQNGDQSVDGMYAGNNGVAGRLHGTWNRDTTMMSYTWTERDGDSQNSGTKTGWGNMVWNNDGSRMTARWAFQNESQTVGLWNAALINP